MNRKLLTTVVITVLLIWSATSLANAGVTYTWDYTKFNTSTPDYRKLEEKSTSIKFSVYQHLTFNGTTSNAKAIIGFCNASSGTIYHVDIVYVKDNTFEVVINTPAYIKIAEGTWEVNQTTYVDIDSDGNILIWASQDDGDVTYVDDYNVGTIEFAYISGSGANDSCTQGYISAEEGYGGQYGSIVTDWIPTILSMAMLGIALGMVKKFG